MTPQYELELILTSASQLKNINWRNGTNKPYAVAWIDPNPTIKFTTNVDENGNTSSQWKNQPLIIPLPTKKQIHDLILYIQIVHAGFEKKLIGETWLKVLDVFEDGIGQRLSSRMLTLKRPSGRSQGVVEVKVGVREIGYGARGAGFDNQELKTREYSSTSQVYGYPYGGQGPRPRQQGYNVGSNTASYGQVGGRKENEFDGMGMGLAVGAIAGVLGGIALVEGVKYIEERIVEDVVERVEEDLGYDDDDVVERGQDDDFGYDDDVAERVEDDMGYDYDNDNYDNDNDNDNDDGGYDGDDF